MAKFKDREDRRKASIIGSMVASVPDAGSRKGRPKEDRETKKRVSLSVLPSLYEDIQKIAYVQRRSISDLVGDQLELYRTQHKGELAEYEAIRDREGPAQDIVELP